MVIASTSISYGKLLAIITLNHKKVKIGNNVSETSIIKNSTLFARLWNIAEACEMMQFSESNVDAHNEVINVMLRYAQRHSGKFLRWLLSLELHEKKRMQSKLCICFFEK